MTKTALLPNTITERLFVELIERVKGMKESGYSNSDISDVLGMSEDSVELLLQGEVPEHLAKFEINRMASQHHLTKMQLFDKVKAHITETERFTDEMEVFGYWANLSTMKKLDIVQTVLKDI